MKGAVVFTPSRSRPPLRLPMTPLIDIVFLLLVFFVCTVQFREPEDLLATHMALAGSGGEQVAPPPAELDLGPINVTVTKQQLVAEFQGRRFNFSAADFEAALTRLTAQVQRWLRHDAEIPIRLRSDPDVSTVRFLRVYDAFLQAGIQRVDLVPEG